MENPFVKLSAVDFKDHLEVKKSGNTELKYVSWAYAWAEVKKLYPAASYEVKKFNGLPYVYDPITGFMVYTTVTIEGISHEMWLPVLDSSNKAMKAVPRSDGCVHGSHHIRGRYHPRSSAVHPPSRNAS